MEFISANGAYPESRVQLFVQLSQSEAEYVGEIAPLGSQAANLLTEGGEAVVTSRSSS